MDKFDEKVIGYESTKDILRQILDILKRPEVYKRKGISIPRGLLMESDPGLGKSLLASILMEESERKPFVFRKTSQENSFLDIYILVMVREIWRELQNTLAFTTRLWIVQKKSAFPN